MKINGNEIRPGNVIEHNGGNGIFYADFMRFIDEDIVIIVASNRSEDASGGYVRAIRQLILPSASGN